MSFRMSSAIYNRLSYNGGLNLCLMNGYYDNQNKDKVITKGTYWEVYDNQQQIAESQNTHQVFINLGVEDLKAEYDRIKSHPDGNPIEITGEYAEE